MHRSSTADSGLLSTEDLERAASASVMSSAVGDLEDVAAVSAERREARRSKSMSASSAGASHLRQAMTMAAHPQLTADRAGGDSGRDPGSPADSAGGGERGSGDGPGGALKVIRLGSSAAAPPRGSTAPPSSLFNTADVLSEAANAVADPVRMSLDHTRVRRVEGH